MLAVGVGIGGCSTGEPTVRYARSIRVDGYRKTSWGWNRKTLDIFFVGPVTTHLEDAIHGPGLQLRAADAPVVDIAFHALFTGTLVEKGRLNVSST